MVASKKLLTEHQTHKGKLLAQNANLYSSKEPQEFLEFSNKNTFKRFFVVYVLPSSPCWYFSSSLAKHSKEHKWDFEVSRKKETQSLHFSSFVSLQGFGKKLLSVNTIYYLLKLQLATTFTNLSSCHRTRLSKKHLVQWFQELFKFYQGFHKKILTTGNRSLFLSTFRLDKENIYLHDEKKKHPRKKISKGKCGKNNVNF